MKQQSFFKTPPMSHGGSSAMGKRKKARPIALKRPMHITFKSARARGKWNLLRFEREISDQIRALAKRYRVKVHRCRNVGNHLHLVTQAASRPEIQSFLRVVPQAIAFLVTGARKGNAIGRFWDNLVHSRVVSWGRDWRNLLQYLSKNEIEAAGAPRELVDKCFEKIRVAIRDG